MQFKLLHDLAPEVAERETRTIMVQDGAESGLPPGEYSFLEMFCAEPGCDCRRVFFYVVSSLREGLEAVITWGWESREFYIKWMHFDDPKMITELMGPSLNLGSPATELAPALLDLARNVLLQDADYVERVKRHYRLFRDKVDGKPAVTGKRRKRKKSSRKPKERSSR